MTPEEKALLAFQDAYSAAAYAKDRVALAEECFAQREIDAKELARWHALETEANAALTAAKAEYEKQQAAKVCPHGNSPESCKVCALGTVEDARKKIPVVEVVAGVSRKVLTDS